MIQNEEVRYITREELKAVESIGELYKMGSQVMLKNGIWAVKD